MLLSNKSDLSEPQTWGCWLCGQVAAGVGSGPCFIDPGLQPSLCPLQAGRGLSLCGPHPTWAAQNKTFLHRGAPAGEGVQGPPFWFLAQRGASSVCPTHHTSSHMDPKN